MTVADDLAHAHEKLAEAVDMLATGQRGITDRLHRVFIHALANVEPIDGGPDDRELLVDIEHIKHDLAAEFDSGMTDGKAVEFARRLVQLNDRVGRIYWIQQAPS